VWATGPYREGTRSQLESLEVPGSRVLPRGCAGS